MKQKQHEYLQACIANAKAKLAEPNVAYPNGRMSHEVMREVLCNSEEELEDLKLSGRFYADGRFAGYADEEE
jgi:hypothetical protein